MEKLTRKNLKKLYDDGKITTEDYLRLKDLLMRGKSNLLVNMKTGKITDKFIPVPRWFLDMLSADIRFKRRK